MANHGLRITNQMKTYDLGPIPIAVDTGLIVLIVAAVAVTLLLAGLWTRREVAKIDPNRELRDNGRP